MAHSFPTTTSLRIFEAAARHLSCVGAARELFMTQSAVSKQLMALETHLGVRLFERVSRGLALTTAGKEYLVDVISVLRLLTSAQARISAYKEGRETLTLQVLASFAERWLLPRFSDFHERYPNILVHFTTYLSKDRKDTVEPDAHFMFGQGELNGYLTDRVIGGDVIAVASPKLVSGKSGIASFEDLSRHTLMQHFEMPHSWPEFGEQSKWTPGPEQEIVRYEFFSVMIKAASASLGVALIPRFLVQDELTAGRLVQLFDLSIESRYAYYFAYPVAKRHNRTLQTFRRWVLAEARKG